MSLISLNKVHFLPYTTIPLLDDISKINVYNIPYKEGLYGWEIRFISYF